jgi:nicotinic acid phosphoribosyltransferase
MEMVEQVHNLKEHSYLLSFLAPLHKFQLLRYPVLSCTCYKTVIENQC